MTLVEIRCKARGCGKLLGEITELPADYAGWLLVPPCRRHDSVHAMIRNLGDRDPDRAAEWATEGALPVAWELLRPDIERALATGRTEIHAI